MHIEDGTLQDCEKSFAEMDNAELVGQMWVMLGAISTLKRLRTVGINPVNVAEMLVGFEGASVILNRLAKARGIDIQMH